MLKKKSNIKAVDEEFDLYDDAFEQDAIRQLTTQTRQRTIYEDSFDQSNQEVNSLWKTSATW